MATTSTVKKTTATTTAKKKPGRPPKPKPIEAEAVIEEKPKPVKAIRKEEKPSKIRVFIPLDPSESTREQIIDGSVNGKFFTLERGKEYLLDQGVAEYILFRIKTAYELEQYVEKTRWKE